MHWQVAFKNQVSICKSAGIFISILNMAILDDNDDDDVSDGDDEDDEDTYIMVECLYLSLSQK